MSRPSKPVQIRPVDSLDAEPEDVVRLTTREGDEPEKSEPRVILGPGAEYKGPSNRVKLSLREDLETRSVEPDIETLIDAETPAPEQLENDWGDQKKNTKPIAWGWFAILALAMGAGTFWSLYQIEKSEEQNLNIQREAKSLITDEEEKEREAARQIDAMEALLRSFHNATSIEAMLPLVRDPARVKPLMENHYGRDPVPLVRLRSIRSLNPLTIGSSGKFWVASVSQSGDSVKNILIEIDDDGKPLIDWETYVCYQPMPWDDYVAQRPTGVSLDFRVVARLENFFSHEFSSPSRWLCLELNVPGSIEFLYGYAPVESEAAAQIADLIRYNGGDEASMILRLRIPENLKSNRGVIVEKLVSTQWLFTDSPAVDP